MKYSSFLIKPASGSCNMACRYCFYRDVSAHREQGNLGLMSGEILEALVRRALEETEYVCSFAFQGGEPTLVGLPFYRQLVELQQKYNTHGVRIQNSIQTNGYRLNEEWARFFAENHFLVGISIDGTRELHDAARVNAVGNGTYDDVERVTRLFDTFHVEYNILCVVTASLARRGEQVYRHFLRHNWRYMQFIPCLDPLEAERGEEQWSLTPERYGRFLCRLYDAWYTDARQHKAPSVRHIDNWLGILCGYPPENCAMSGQCQPYFVVEADGGVYPCDFYVTDEWRMGNIASDSLDNLLHSETAKRFRLTVPLTEECRQCVYAPLCRGGCRRDRMMTAEGFAVNYYCEAYRKFFAHALPSLRQLALNPRSPYRVG